MVNIAVLLSITLTETLLWIAFSALKHFCVCGVPVPLGTSLAFDEAFTKLLWPPLMLALYVNFQYVVLSVICTVPIPMDLARGSHTMQDSGTETLMVNSLSSDHACDSQPQDNVAAAVLFDGENGETSLSSFSTNADLQSDNCYSVLDNTACNEISSSQTATVETHNGQIFDDATDGKDACLSLVQETNSRIEDDSFSSDMQPVDIHKLGSALWPRSTFDKSDVADYSFTTLTAEFQNYCKENAEDVTGQKEIPSSCGETGSMQVNQEVEWSVVSRWIEESNQQFNSNFPECSALICGLPMPDKKQHVDGDTSSKNLSSNVALVQAIDSGFVSSLGSADPAASSGNLITSISNKASECSNLLLPPAVLTREKILSLQFNRVPLTAEVMSRIKELKLRRTDSVLDGKRVTENLLSSKWQESNPSSIKMLKSAWAMSDIPANSAGTKGTYRGQSTSAGVTDTPAMSHNLPDFHAASVCDYMLLTSSCETQASADIVANSVTQPVTSGHHTLQSFTSQSYTVPIMSNLPPVSDLPAVTSVTNVIFEKAKPSHKVYSAADTMHAGPTVAVSLNNSTVSLSIPATANLLTVTQSENVHSIASKVLPQTASPAVGDRPPAKKYSTHDISADHNYHKEKVSSSVQDIPRSKHSITNRNPRREVDKKLTEDDDFSHTEDSHSESSVPFPAAEISHSRSGLNSRCPKCSCRQNAKSSSAYDPTSNNTHSYQSHASRHKAHRDLYEHYGEYVPCYMPHMAPSVLASVSYSSYCLGAYDAHVRSMYYYNMLSRQTAANLWQQQADYIHRMTKHYARSKCEQC